MLKSYRQFKLVILMAIFLSSTTIQANDNQHRFLGSAYASGNIFIIDRDGNVEWQMKAREVQDAAMLDNGDILFHDKKSVKIVNKRKEIQMEYKIEKGVNCDIHSATPLDNGNILVSLSGLSKVVELDRQGKVVKEIMIQSEKPDAHMQMRDSEFTKDGTYLIALAIEQKVVEYDENGKLIRTIDSTVGEHLGTPSDVQRLKNGNTLIATGYSKMILEIDENDKVVWSLKNGDIEGFEMDYPAAAVRLENGNTLISLYHGTHMWAEVTPDKKIVWGIKVDSIEGIKGPTSITYLD